MLMYVNISEYAIMIQLYEL